MKELSKYKTELIGQKLAKVLHTDQGKGVEHLNGLGYAYYFSTVLELENGQKYRFGSDWMEPWDKSEKLYEVTHNIWEIKKSIKFKKIRISDLLIDHYDDLYIKLENDTLIYHTIDYGDRLFFDKYSDLFDGDGKLIEEDIITKEDQKITKTEIKTPVSNNERTFWSKLKSRWS